MRLFLRPFALLFFLLTVLVALAAERSTFIDTSSRTNFNRPACIDSFERFILRNPDLNYASNALVETRDGNYLSAGYFGTRTSPFITGGMLMKISPQGDPLWTRKVSANRAINLGKCHELANESVIVAGTSYISRPINGTEDLLLIRADKNGEILWSKTFQTPLWTDTTRGLFDVQRIISDANNNFYIIGNIRPDGPPRHIMVIKFDVDGNILWQKAINLVDLPYINNAFLRGNELWLFGQHSSSSVHWNTPFMLRLNKDNGDTLSARAIYPDVPLPANQYLPHGSFAHVTALANGNFSMHATGVSVNSLLTNGRATHGLSIEVDSNFNFVKGYRITSNFLASGGMTRLTVQPDGSADLLSTVRVSNGFIKAFYTRIENGQIVKERYIPYNGYEMAFSNDVLVMKDGSRLFFQSMHNYTFDPGKTIAELMFLKLQNSNTSGVCTGIDTSLFQVENISYKTQPFTQKPTIYSGFLQRTYYTTITGNVNETTTKLQDCSKASVCDTLSIKRINPNVCLANPVRLTVFRNSECGAMPVWFYDTSVTSPKKINDTITEFTFRKEWSGYLKTQIINRCGVLKDSILLIVTGKTAALNLGKDTSICPSNSILLKAPKGYASYQWQDGTSDSLYTVSAPGTYFVNVNDACGNLHSDTIHITAASGISFNVGDVFAKCNRETLSVSAPDGFLSYQWSPGYGISSTTGKSVLLNPDKDTTYFIAAEKSPGCFVYDTIKVKVNTSPDIRLGNDTSLCDGRSLTLDAGMGFTGYLWSNQSAGSSITIAAAGTYSVVANAANGCVSKDTILIRVSRTPQFSMGADTGICVNTGYLVQPAVNGNFTWQDKSAARTMMVAKAGIYWLEVNDNGCSFRDSLIITSKPSPVRKLSPDTLLCDQSKLTLNVSQTGNAVVYNWQDGIKTAIRDITSSGTYTVNINLDGCEVNDTVKAVFRFTPVFSLGKDTAICQDETLELNAFVAGCNYLWQDQSTNPVYSANKTGTYFCKVSNECGVTTDEIVVTTQVCECEAKVPNVFSPNGDGINDVFKPELNCRPVRYHLQIFDRNGSLIFESNNAGIYWDGTYKGKPVPLATYYFRLHLQGASDATYKEKSGGILVIR